MSDQIGSLTAVLEFRDIPSEGRLLRGTAQEAPRKEGRVQLSAGNLADLISSLERIECAANCELDRLLGAVAAEGPNPVSAKADKCSDHELLQNQIDRLANCIRRLKDSTLPRLTDL